MRYRIRSRPPGAGDEQFLRGRAGAFMGRPALSYWLKPYPDRCYDRLGKPVMVAGAQEGTAMCNSVDVAVFPQREEVQALLRRYHALVGDTLTMAALGHNPAQVDAARAAAAEALRRIRTFAGTGAGAQAQAAASALSAGEDNLL